MIEGLNPYAEYKGSGVPWLATMPSHWRTVRNGTLFQQRNDTGYPDLPVLEVSLRTGVRVRAFGASQRKQVMADARKYKRAAAGDVAYNMMRMWQGAVGVAPVEGLVSPAYVVARPFAGTEARYYTTLFRISSYMGEIDAASRGIVKDRNRLYWDQFKQMRSLVPPPDEQTAIVRFLDHANRKIDGFIRAKRKLIGLLNEQKQAIIHRAVTRGLNPNAPLKPSGIPWLGDIPKHWDVRRMKNIGNTKIGLTYSPADVTESTGCLVLRASNIKNGQIARGNDVFVGKSIPDWLRVSAGDILICARSGSRSLVGKSALIPRDLEGVSFGAFMSLFRSPINDFVFWVLNSNMLKFVMAEFETSTINQLTQGDLNKLSIPVPPRSEQLTIIGFIQDSVERLNAAIARTEREISLMQEYRTRLTADVVTGKLDVREAAAKLPDSSIHDAQPEESDMGLEPDEGDDENSDLERED